MSDPFAKMNERLFERLGGASTLRGNVAVRASLEHGVAMTGEYGEVVAYRSIADIYPASAAPRSGDALVVEGVSYTIDAAIENDGASVRCVLR